MQRAGPSAVASTAVSRSTASAIAPSATAATPPRPIARPIESPEAMPTRPGMYSWLMTRLTLNVPITAMPAKKSGDDADRAADEHVDEDERRRDDEAPEQDATAAEPVGERPAEERAERAGEEEEREQPRPVGGALAA